MMLTRHQILLRKGDFGRLGKIYPERSATSVVREIVSRHIQAAGRRKAEAKIKRKDVTS
jgi:hypothetical protein